MIPIDPTDFTFATDEESFAYLREVVEDMMRRFGVRPDECVGRINQAWAHVPAVAGDDEIYREVPGYWANHFMFGKASFWWLSAAERERQNLGPLQPLPYAKANAA